jgi:hypothetical protein
LVKAALRLHRGEGWQPVCEASNLPWNDEGATAKPVLEATGGSGRTPAQEAFVFE